MPYRGKRIAVVVPAHDEERFVKRVIVTIPLFVDDIIVINDGSQDKTLSRVRACADARVSCIHLNKRNGVGAAITNGYDRALCLGAEIVAVMAGDGQMDPCDLPSLLDPLVEGRADYAKGNRFLDPAVGKKMPLIRQLGNILLSFLTRFVTGVPVRDSQCGYTAITAQALRLLLDMPACRGYGYPNRVLVNLSILHKKVIEVPVQCIYGMEDSGIIIPSYFFRMIFILTSCFLYRLFRMCVPRPSRKREREPSRVCLLTSSYPRFDGDIAGAFIRDLCGQLAVNGYSFDIVTPDGEGAALLQDDNIHIHRFAYFWPRRFQGLCYGAGIESNLSRNLLLSMQVPFFFFFLFFKAWVLSRRCAVIWSHWLIPSGLIGAIISKVSGKPHVLTVHAGGIFALGRLPLGRCIARFIGRHSAVVTAVSSFSLNQYRELVANDGSGLDNIIVQPLGVNTTALGSHDKRRLREKHGFNGKCVIFFMGRLVRIKGLHILLQAASCVENATVIIAGEGPEKERLKGMARELGVEVAFRGFLSGPLKYELLTVSDVLVYPSLVEAGGRTEGCPVVILESLACGCPVVASAVGGIPELIRDGYNGYLVPSGDVNALVEKLRDISMNGEDLKKLARGAYESGRSYGLESVAPAFKRIFQDAAA